MKRLIQGMVWLVALAALVACQAPVGGPNGGGSLTINLADGVSRTLTPTLSMTPALYTLDGSGPGGATFSQDVTGASATLTSLAFGSWSVVVTAKNATGTAIGTGSGTVVVHSNTSASLSVTVTPYAGTGTLSLTTNWTAADVDVAQVEASLLPATGPARTLGFTVDGATGTASFSATDVTTGYHTLSLKLLDNGALVMGAVEVARIVKDQTTTGVYQFTDVNKATGSLTVNVSAAMGDPLTVSIAGSSATLSQGSTQSLTASVAEAGVNAVYVWYVNGVSVGTGTTYAFGANQPLGTYRIDVTAYSADGTRAGSATSTVHVVAAVAGNENYTSASIGTLVFVPAGSFQRDATATNISVITQPYRMSAHEITRAQFLAVMGTDPSNTTYSGGYSDPVQMTNWYHAIAFCNKLSLAEGLAPVYSVEVSGASIDWATLTYASIPSSNNSYWSAATATWTSNGYRLPTEMEWMWAAMGAPADGQGAGTNTTGYAKAFAGSTGSNAIGDFAWYRENVTDVKSRPVGGKLANELGLYDMSGNVWEWNWDWYASPTGTQTDYRGAASGTYRVFRGGDWGNAAKDCSVATPRNKTSPDSRGGGIGFRVVRP